MTAAAPAPDAPAQDLYEIVREGGRTKLALNQHPGQLRGWFSNARFLAILAGTQSGKALALDTPIPTPGGLVPMGDLRDGDTVFDESGRPCRVARAHDVLFGRDCYRVTFDDGTSVVADGGHPWPVRRGDGWEAVTTEQVRAAGGAAGLAFTRARIASVEPAPSVPVRCITVDSATHLYLCGESRAPTHNTSWGPLWLWREIYGDGNRPGRGEGDYLAVTASYDLFKLKMLPAIREVFEGAFGVGRYWSGDRVMELRPHAGAPFLAKKATDPMWGRIILRSAEAGSGLESATAKAAWLDEAGQESFTLQTWEAVLSRLSLNLGRVLITTTLYNFGWLKTEFHDRWAAGDPKYDVIHFDSLVNPRFPREEWDRARGSMPEWRFDLRYRGRYSRPAGLIYDSYRDEPYPAGHLIDDFPIPWTWERFGGLDFGGANTAATKWAEDPITNYLYGYAEYLAGDRSAKEHAAELAEGEPTFAAWVGGSPSEGQWRREFKAGGLKVLPPAVAEVPVGIDRVYAGFKERRVFIFKSLTGLRRELRNYSRKLGPDGEPTEVIENKASYHLLDSARYVLGWKLGPTAAERGVKAAPDPLAGYTGTRRSLKRRGGRGSEYGGRGGNGAR